MAVARGILIRPRSQNFRIDADFIDNVGATITTGTFTASVSEVQDDGTLRAIDFNGSPPTICATAATVPTTGTISLTNRPSGNTSRAYWSATFDPTNLTIGGVYLVEYTVPAGVTQPRPKLIQFGASDGDVMDAPSVLTGKVTSVTSTSSFTVTFDSTPDLNQANLIAGDLYLSFTSGLNQGKSRLITGGTLSGAAGALTFTTAFPQTVSTGNRVCIVSN